LRAGGGLEEQIDEGAALEQAKLFSAERLSADVIVGQIEQSRDLADRNSFDSKQMACLQNRAVVAPGIKDGRFAGLPQL
jgi:hypothetical protein